MFAWPAPIALFFGFLLLSAIPANAQIIVLESSETGDEQVEAQDTVARAQAQSVTRQVLSSISNVTRGAGKRGGFRAPSQKSARSNPMLAMANDDAIVCDVGCRTNLFAASDGEVPDQPSSSVWINGSAQTVEVTPDGSVTLKRTSDLASAILGFDTFLSDQILLGGNAIFLDSDTSSTSRANNPLRLDTKSFGVSAYGAYLMNENISLSGILGVTRNSVDSVEEIAAGNTTSDFRSLDIFGYAGGDWTDYIDAFDWTASLGVVFTRSRTDGFTDSTGAHTDRASDFHYQGILSLSGGYTFDIDGSSTSLHPYGIVAYERDKSLEGVGENGLRVSAGIDFFGSENLTVSLEGNILAYKEDQDEIGGFLNVNYSF